MEFQEHQGEKAARGLYPECAGGCEDPQKRVWKKESALRPDPLSPFCKMLGPPHQGTQGSVNGWEIISKVLDSILYLFLSSFSVRSTFT